MKIIEREGDAYTILDLVTRRPETVHISRIFPFIYDSTRVDPENFAHRDREEFEVERILDDTIDVSLSTRHWQFQVLWKGYDMKHLGYLGIHLKM
jgi:hypothetical protein